ncbi:hypothetical protein CPS_3875 [Colwellia psychrerythraea 34H]|uniref:Uncharacterized protein n=1 Tax=Colwellia psychrerythraea (strain 34H / ATCC BAA-681) TaxID=167879 RepID=Q47XD3_COLP3|nr:hypothetical protein CPS_3875 [Colwellia psychrerythraea 34H]
MELNKKRVSFQGTRFLIAKIFILKEKESKTKYKPDK